jgi:ribokinase
VLSWDDLYLLDHYPPEGGFSRVCAAVAGPGGTTGNLAMTARSLGATVSLFAKVGSDAAGKEMLRSLAEAGIDCAGLVTDPGPSDRSILLVSTRSAERTILWQQAPYLRRGDRIDLATLLGADVTVIDCIDLDLRRFLTDLPAHTRPNAQLIGTLTYLANVDAADKVEIALRHDVLIGNEREYRDLIGLADASKCLRTVQWQMAGANLRTAVMTRGPHGAMAATRDSICSVHASGVDAIDTTGAGDAFTGAYAYAFAKRWELERSLSFANAVAGLVVSSLGAQTGIPTLSQALAAARFDE